MIAVAVVFVLIGSMMFAITAYPSFKISFAGLPVKLAGYILGPLVGAVTGFLTDILSFLFLPTFYHPGYSLTMSISGMIPGIVM
jgi:ECF transporter S component (folate family)